MDFQPHNKRFDDDGNGNFRRRNFLPMTRYEMEKRGWDRCDVILLTGDAYIDHPSYGVAVIARLLEDMGLRVGIIAQPNPRRVVDFTQLGEPRLFFGVTSGCSDSMLNNYSPTRRPRKIDNYSPGRLPGKRPDHAPIVYTRSLKEVFPNVPVILGGIEASLRRLAHFDFFDDEVKMSILAESGADLLVYGQGERTMREIVDELREGKGLSGCRKIRGVVWRASLDEKLEATVGEHTMVPSFEETVQSKDAFYDMAKTNLHNMDPHFAKVLVQEHPNAYVVINKPQIPLSTAELDEVYELEYTRTPHPKYKKQGAIPAFETVKFSIMTHRGCNAGCNFCPIYFHQGRYITSRSEENIVDEVEHVSKFHYFRNVISNVGGPVGNVYKSQCAKLDEGAEADGACERPSCTYPDPCKNLTIDQKPYLDLLKQVLAVENVRQAFIASGVRYDLLEHDEHGQELLELLIERLSGRQFKTAVVHVSDSVNRRAGKYTTETTERFMDNCMSTVKKLGIDGDFEIIPYFTASHPGSTMEDALDVAMFLKEHGLERIQIHDFVPTPGTASECMWYTGRDPMNNDEQVYRPLSHRERTLQRSLMQFYKPENARHVMAALRELGRTDLVGEGPHTLLQEEPPEDDWDRGYSGNRE